MLDKAGDQSRYATAEDAFTSEGGRLPAVHWVAPVPMDVVRSTAADATPFKALCRPSQIDDLCLACGLTGTGVERLDGLRFARRRLRTGQALYHQGEKFEFIYAVRSGTFKSHLRLRDGREQVTGFQMAGELLGLDGLSAGEHASSAVALEDAEISAIPYTYLSELAGTSTRLRDVISRLMSSEIVHEHGLMMLLGTMNAEERLASFLLNLSQRMKARGYSASEFHLRMSRAEIGSYLGMRLETVSRTFSAFAQQRLVEVHKKHVRILDFEGMTRQFELLLQ